MNKALEAQLLKIAERKQSKNDPSHDFQHILRVFNLAIEIGRRGKADLDVLIPAALFHDSVVYLKNTRHSKNEAA